MSVPNYWDFFPVEIQAFDSEGRQVTFALEQNYVADGSPFNSDQPNNVISLDQQWWLAMANMLNQSWMSMVAPAYAALEQEVSGDDVGLSFMLPSPVQELFA